MAMGIKEDNVWGILIQQPRLPASLQLDNDATPKNNQTNHIRHTQQHTSTLPVRTISKAEGSEGRVVSSTIIPLNLSSLPSNNCGAVAGGTSISCVG